jgi:hypothetical protein
MGEFKVSEALHTRGYKSNEKASIFSHARAGRQNSEGFGGGYRVGKRP